ncbi:hypothetical protein G5I_11507 [Acromyrmex echinatior]|uniref:Uncharacterized protein n=1 Tax=Acromyrmex echinatior TaxID=103372 RepID=F4WZQ0_ACREC|nr:hypothetical protein G5I_11507 [Acromyrmex echinatior]
MEKQRETPDAVVGNARINGTPIDRVVRHSGDYPNYISSVSRSTSCTTARRMRGRLLEGNIYRIRALALAGETLSFSIRSARRDGPYSVFARNHVPSARRGGSRQQETKQQERQKKKEKRGDEEEEGGGEGGGRIVAVRQHSKSKSKPTRPGAAPRRAAPRALARCRAALYYIAPHARRDPRTRA